MAKIPITLTINGERHEALVEPDRTLLDVLRTDSASPAPRRTASTPSAASAPCCSTARR